MNLAEGIRVALRALAANKLRTALTMLGMIIGVAAVIALISIGRGAQERVTQQIQSLGTSLLFVRPGSVQQGRVQGGAGTVGTLTLDDAVAVANAARAPSVAAVAPEAATGGQVLAGGQNWFTRIVGTTPEYEGVRSVSLASGEFISRQHVDGRAMVAVLGPGVVEKVFGTSDPLGETVRVSTFGNRAALSFRVIGVLEAKGANAFGSPDDQIIVPLSTLQTRLFAQRGGRGGRSPSLATINVQAASEELVDQAVQEVAEVLRQEHRVTEDDFSIQSQKDFLQTFSQITGTFTLLLGSIAGISLVVGGIGIMNIMLVSVAERTREIGIRKAVGARRRDILVQFLMESVVVSLGGGAVGVALGIGISRVLSTIQVPSGAQGTQSLPSVVAPDAVLLAFGVSVAVGLFFGIYPATRAARLNPIEALRYE